MDSPTKLTAPTVVVPLLKFSELNEFLKTLISISSLFGSIGDISRFVLPLTVEPSISTIVVPTETILFFSKVKVSLLSLKSTTSSNWIALFAIFLDCIKNLPKVSPKGTDIFPVKFASLSENWELISSTFKTLFVLHWTNLASFVFFNCTNFDDVVVKPKIVSMSLAKSKLLTASTRWSVIISAETTVALEIPIPACVVDVIPVSAKFLSPLVWSNLFTGSIIWSNVWGLWIVYAKFW